MKACYAKQILQLPDGGIYGQVSPKLTPKKTQKLKHVQPPPILKHRKPKHRKGHQKSQPPSVYSLPGDERPDSRNGIVAPVVYAGSGQDSDMWS